MGKQFLFQQQWLCKSCKVKIKKFCFHKSHKSIYFFPLSKMFRISTNQCQNWKLTDGTREYVNNWYDVSKTNGKSIFVKCKEMSPTSYHFIVLHETNVVGHFCWEQSTEKVYFLSSGKDIELDDIFDIGNSKKPLKDCDSIGEFGDGIKSGMVPIVRDNNRTITWFCKKSKLFVRVKRKGNYIADDREYDPTIIQFPNNIPELTEWYNKTSQATVNVISGIKNQSDICFDNFLFLRYEEEVCPISIDPLDSERIGAEHLRTCILTTPKEIGRIYVKSVFICHKQGLPFGINLVHKTVKIDRDRKNINESLTQIFYDFLLSKDGTGKNPYFHDFIIKKCKTDEDEMLSILCNRQRYEPFYNTLLCRIRRTNGFNIIPIPDSRKDFDEGDHSLLRIVNQKDDCRKYGDLIYKLCFRFVREELNEKMQDVITRIENENELDEVSDAIRTRRENRVNALRNFLSVLLRKHVEVILIDTKKLNLFPHLSLNAPSYLKHFVYFDREESILYLDFHLLHRNTIHSFITSRLEHESEKNFECTKGSRDLEAEVAMVIRDSGIFIPLIFQNHVLSNLPSLKESTILDDDDDEKKENRNDDKKDELIKKLNESKGEIDRLQKEQAVKTKELSTKTNELEEKDSQILTLKKQLKEKEETLIKINSKRQEDRKIIEEVKRIPHKLSESTFTSMDSTQLCEYRDISSSNTILLQGLCDQQYELIIENLKRKHDEEFNRELEKVKRLKSSEDK